MNEQWIMRPGDTFVAEECGCSFTVESGPNDERMARQAPRCCCGHEMHKEGTPRDLMAADEMEMEDGDERYGAPKAMAG